MNCAPPWKTSKHRILLWKPKKEILYKPKEKGKWSHISHGRGCGYRFSKKTEVKMIDDTKKSHDCSFYIHKNDICEIRSHKKNLFFPRNKLRFKKHSEHSEYWGQGGGVLDIWTYTIYLR